MFPSISLLFFIRLAKKLNDEIENRTGRNVGSPVDSQSDLPDLPRPKSVFDRLMPFFSQVESRGSKASKSRVSDPGFVWLKWVTHESNDAILVVTIIPVMAT